MFQNGFYNPYMQQMGMQPQYNPMQMQQPAQIQQNNIPAFLQVGTAKDFETVIIHPGKQALIMAQNDPYIALKSSDAMSIYRLEPVTPDQIKGTPPEYVTRGEFQSTIQQLVDGLKQPQKQAKKEENV